jgi:hypothetical protein
MTTGMAAEAMTFWRWDDAAACWRTVAVDPGAPIVSGSRAVALAVPRGQHGLLVDGDGGNLTINGLPTFPLRILVDRDEIAVGGEVLYFTTEVPASAAPFRANAGGTVACPRCHGAMREGEIALRCPRCRRWHHQSDALPCWSYDPKCAACDRATADAPWQPAPLRRPRPDADMTPGAARA